MSEEKKLNRYRVEYRVIGEHYTKSAILEAETEEQVKAMVFDLQKPKAEPVREPVVSYPVIEKLNIDPLAGLVQEGIREAMSDLAKYGLRVETPEGVRMKQLEGFRFRSLSVNQTRDSYRFCVRMLINKDSNAIEEKLRQTFTVVEDIGTSFDNQDPDGLDKNYPTVDGFHEWVCVVGLSKKLNVPPLEFAKDTYTLKYLVTWGPDAEHLYYEQTGKDLSEASEDELLAMIGGGLAYLNVVLYELGGDDYTDHRELCEDGYKFVGLESRVKIKGAPVKISAADDEGE